MSNWTYPQANVSVKLAVYTATPPGGGAVSNLVISKCILVPDTLDGRVAARSSATRAPDILLIHLGDLAASTIGRGVLERYAVVGDPDLNSDRATSFAGCSAENRCPVLFHVAGHVAVLPHLGLYTVATSLRVVYKNLWAMMQRDSGFWGVRKCEMHARLISGVRRRLD